MDETTWRGQRQPLGRPHWLAKGIPLQPDERANLPGRVRSSLALPAGAIAVAQIVPPFQVAGARTALACLLALSGLGVAASAYRRWSKNERAMRHGRTLPHTTGLVALTTALCAIAVAVLALVVLDHR